MWFKTLNLAGRALLPIVQGGMGVGISAHRLAGAVANENAVGTIASVNLRHHHPDLIDATDRCRDRDTIDQANRVALNREIRAAKDIAKSKGMVAVNVMKAVRDHAVLVSQACESGADAIVIGAGLPIDLPDMTADHPKVALIPILSESRGVGIVLKKWLKRVVSLTPSLSSTLPMQGGIWAPPNSKKSTKSVLTSTCLLYTSDAAETSRV